MEEHSEITIFIFICFNVLIMLWVFKSSRDLIIQIFDTRKFIIKNLSKISLYIAVMAYVPSLFPDYLEQYSILSLYIVFSILIGVGSNQVLQHKHNMGKLLIKSSYIPKINYLFILILGFGLWGIRNSFLILTNQLEVSRYNEYVTYLRTYFDYTEFDYRIEALDNILIFFSVAFMFPISIWKQLEIRDGGIYYHSKCIEWDDITSYSWQEEKSNILQIEYQGTLDKQHQLKIQVAKDEKEEISNILQQKLNQS